MKSFYEHLRSRHEFGEKIDYKKKPILRSSGIFPVIKNNSYSSQILFLGYWVIKRKIPEVSFLVTLRSNDGIIIMRDFFTIDNPKSHTISLDSLLEKTSISDKSNFLGSIEVEIFSTQDMVFPYPALVLDYFNNEFNTCVHTLGRVYNDIEDLNENETFSVPETGFDIYADNDLHAFLSFVNGPLSNPNAIIDYVITNSESKKLTGNFTLDNIKPYQTVFFKFQDHIPNLSQFLNGKVGAITIKHNFVGFFPRFLVGNIQNSLQSASFTHSYYDCTSCSDPLDYWNRISESHYDSSVSIPLFADDDLFTDLVIYPNISPSTFDLDIKLHDQKGSLLLDIPNFMRISSHDSKLFKINFNELLAKNNIDAKNASTAHIITNFHDKKIPTRIKFGLNIGKKGSKSKLPCNICFNSKLGNPLIDNKPGSFHWCPIFSTGNTVISFENSSSVKNYSKNANLLLTFYREKDTNSIEKEITIPANGEFRFELAKNHDVLQFLNGNVGWITAKSDNPYIQCYYFNFHSSGVVAGDHLF
jgi:hypothetical protein